MSVPLQRNTAGQSRYIFLFDGADMVLTPTIAAGDFQVSIDGGAFNNLATLPAETPAASGQVEIAFSAAETNGTTICVRWRDQVGAEWDDGAATWETSTSTFASLATAIAAVCPCVTAWFAKAVSTVSTLVVGDVTIIRGDTLILQFEGIGDISTRDNIWFTVKSDKDDLDTSADVQVDEDNGLLYINGVDAQAAGWAADGTITVTDAVAGDLTVRVEAVQTAKITTCSRNWYDLQVLWLDGTVSTVSKGLARVIGDLTRATS